MTISLSKYFLLVQFLDSRELKRNERTEGDGGLRATSPAAQLKLAVIAVVLNP